MRVPSLFVVSSRDAATRYRPLHAPAAVQIIRLRTHQCTSDSQGCMLSILPMTRACYNSRSFVSMAMPVNRESDSHAHAHL
eukprot:138311-Chlamydomonas_euryale.AAC.4